MALKSKDDIDAMRGDALVGLVARACRGTRRRSADRIAGIAMPALLDNLLVFGRLLRALGLEVHVGRLLDIAEALPHVNLAAREDVYHTCRALLVHRHEDLAVFDRAFDAFWRVHGDGLPRRIAAGRHGAAR